MSLWWQQVSEAVLVLTFPPEYAFHELDSQLSEFARYLRELAVRREPKSLALLVDTSAIRSSISRNRARIAQGVQEVHSELERLLVGQAYVASSAIARGGLTALSWLRPAAWPVKIFSQRTEAVVWLEEQLRAAHRGGHQTGK